MAIPINSSEPMFQIVFNNSLISYPLFSVFTLLLLLFIGIALIVAIFLKQLPSHIYKRLEKKIDKELDLLNIIRSQVEPKKVDIYIKLSEHFSAMFAERFLKDGKPIIPFDKSYFDEMVRLFFFASDTTIKQYTALKQNANASKQLDLYFKLYASFILSMRQDLQADTKCTEDDFLNILGFKFTEK